MKTLPRKPWTLLAGTLAAGLAVSALLVHEIARGQGVPALSIVSSSPGQVTVTVTNGTSSGMYQLYYTEFLGSNVNWILWTNGMTGQTNFSASLQTDTGFFKAATNSTSATLVLSVTIQTPANGSNVQ